MATPRERSMLLDKVSAAVVRRETLDLPPATTLIRLFHDAADGVKDLVIDRFGPAIRIDVRSPHLAALAPHIADVVLELLPDVTGAALIERPKGGGTKAKLNLVRGEVAPGVLVTERGQTFLVRLLKENAPLAGAFVDLRAGRQVAQAHAAHRPALNLFAHAGAFGVAMATGGATRVDHVDAARSCAPWAALNLALNGIDPRRHRFIIDDAFKFLRRAAKKGPQYGVIAADPPTTAARPGGRFVVADALVPLAADACRALAPQGVLLLTTNDRRISVAEVESAAREGAKKAGRDVVKCDAIATPPDLMPMGKIVGDIPVRGVALLVQ